MKEIREIVKAYKAAKKEGKRVALGTVVHLEGSSYRRPGARMLVEDSGLMTGAISGGCLEGDALRKALLVISQNKSKLITYDTSDEEDAIVGAQLGCAGIIQVLLEPIDHENENNPIYLLEKTFLKRQNSVLITLFDINNKLQDQVGTCMLVEQGGEISGAIEISEINEDIHLNAQEAIQNKKSKFIHYDAEDKSISAFIEYMTPPISLIIIGAGNDAIPLVNIADCMGWEANVVDGRNNLAKRERFVAACQVLVSKPEQILNHITVDDHTVFVLMTHNYNYDLAILEILIENKDINYLGCLGPKKKFQRMLDDLAAKGKVLTQEQINKIYSPVGYDIGAETAEEIALSIVAEIKGVISEKAGASLRTKPDVIHPRSDTQMEYKKLEK
jgi:xanthine dehydrogenase accessory factor